MKRQIKFAIGYLLCLLLIACLPKSGKPEVIYQFSTLQALLQGLYDGNINFEQLKKHGDMGLGTFNSLDGEMLGFDGKFYKVDYSGKVLEVDNATKTPFAAVTFFDIDKIINLQKPYNYTQLKTFLDKNISSKNYFYAFKIHGKFKYIKARSVPKQSKPYQPLLKIIHEQNIFEFTDIEGTLVGFRCPSYVKALNVPGYHLHFISDDKQKGGHLLDCTIESIEINLDVVDNLYMELPTSKTFQNMDFSKDLNKAAKKVEQIK
jgi:acetolactate decarboxylase